MKSPEWSDYLEWRKALSLGDQIVRLDTLQAQQVLIENTIGELLNCHVELWLNPKEFTNRVFPGSNYAAQPPSPLTQRACDLNQVIQEEVRSDTSSKLINGDAPRTHRSGSVVGAPITFDQYLVGAFILERKDGPGLNPRELDFLDALTRQCAFALHASNRLHVDQHRLEMLSLVRSVSAQVADVLNLDELARRVTHLILDTFHYYFVAIYTIEPDQDQLRFMGSAGPQISDLLTAENQDITELPEPDHQPISVRLGEGMIGTVAASGVKQVANDVAHNLLYRAMDALPETRAEIALPLITGKRVLGVLDVQSDQADAFDDTDMLVLHALADNIATAIENARLYGDLRKRADQLSSLAEVSNAITSLLNQDELLNEVVRLLHKQMGYAHVHVFLVQPVRQQISYQAGDELPAMILAGKTIDFDLTDTKQLIPRVVKNADTVIIPQTYDQSEYPSWNEYSPDIRSEIAVPLIFGDRVLGVLDLQCDTPAAFGEDDQFLLELFAANVAIAIRNANLYHSEQWRRQVADSMREVAVLLTADADLQQVLDLILIEMQRSLPCDYAAIWLLEQSIVENPEPGLSLSAVRLSDTLPDQFGETGRDQVMEIFHACSTAQIDQDWLLQGLQTEEPRIYAPGTPIDPIAACLGFPMDHSAISAPLRVAEHSFGMLHLGHHTPGRYGYESQMMTATFASYAAVAIENTRLYEAAHDQAWISTVLLEVAEATQSLATLEELLATMVRITPMLIGLNSCAIFLWDDREELFIPVAAHGIDDGQMRVFNMWRIALGDETPFDQMFFSRQGAFIDREQLSASPILQLLYGEAELYEAPSVALVPMTAHGEIMGAMLVAFQAAPDGQVSREGPHNIDIEDKFAIVQGIAQQTAVAVENIQLLKAQKEEAYVSVALLQVAQAIVSLNALDEILESIVRLTPILIGVKRCAIFLWDGARNEFRISQTYGFSRSEINDMQTYYRMDEFKLLEAVRQTNNLAYHALDEDSEAPVTWPGFSEQNFSLISLERYDDHKEYGGAEPLEPKDYLRVQNNLLFAYPLTVKGSVLGVMLTQEMESAGIPSLHIREKRHEISIGITQQAALAIQNDLLQCEVLERERLEQEMQLARNIQQTFLPDTLLQPENWDLDVRWEPAREVGGDFYDTIELPENHLGIVIADVADKGMPAALYMTLIRTLIRATARELHSPAAVLKRVNDLLVNESKHGMFVTVAYAVINLNTGEFAYANAGHNYPLLLSHTGNIVRLPTTGMALGVIEEIVIGELTYQLEPQDLLVFYTDGVTEAFTATGEMFGEAKLFRVIQENKGARAAALLDAIEQSIEDHIQGAPVSDDVTLVALRFIPGS